ncbi:MAG: hypothetical protein D6744_14120, partial [Planctomycetota bacterium]
VSAGHPRPLRFNRTGALESLVIPLYPPLGIGPQRYETAHARIDADEWLLMFTDGVTDACNHADERLEDLGFARIADVVFRENRRRPAVSLVEALNAELTAYQGQAQAVDDRTFLALHRGAASLPSAVT